MARRFVDQLRDGDALEDVYLVTDKQLRRTERQPVHPGRAPRPHRRAFGPDVERGRPPCVRAFDPATSSTSTARCNYSRAPLQVILARDRATEPQQVELADFLPHTEQDVRKLNEKLRGYVPARNPHLRRSPSAS